MRTEKIQSLSFADLSIIGIIAAWVVLSIIFGFRDLEISLTVVNLNSFWGSFGAEYGEIPGYGIIAVSAVVFIGSYAANMKKQNYCGYMGILSGVAVFAYGLFENSQQVMVLGGSIAVSILLFMILTPRKNWIEYRKISMFVLLLTLIVPLISVQGLKVLSGRVRFYDLAPDFSDYTPWYIFQGPSQVNSSFPSGHTVMGWMLLPLLIPLWGGKRNQSSKIIWTGLILVWGMFVGVSRIIIGAHYASDVLFSTGFMFLASYVLYKKLYCPSRPANAGMD